MVEGQRMFADTVAALDHAAWSRPSLLPGWTRRHVIAHVAANADALGNLVHWAATGEPTPMYASPTQRADDIEAGARLSPTQLRNWLGRSANGLDAAMSELTPASWNVEIVTAQGRQLPASVIPWLRAREVFVHTVDLNHGVSFADLPADFLQALRDDVVAKRGEVPVSPDAVPLDQALAYLTGRPHQLASITGTEFPQLPPWL
jgi:maleylpyruvate isomerase